MKGNEDLRGKGGKGKILGGKGLRKKKEKRTSTGKGGKDLRKEKGEDLGGQRP